MLRGNLSTIVVYSNRCHVTLAASPPPSTSLTGSASDVCHLRLSPNELEVGLTLDPTAPLRGVVRVVAVIKLPLFLISLLLRYQPAALVA